MSQAAAMGSPLNLRLQDEVCELRHCRSATQTLPRRVSPAVETVRRTNCYSGRLGSAEKRRERVEGDINNIARYCLLRVVRGESRLGRSEDLAPQKWIY